MGLSIAAYKNLKIVNNPELDEEGYVVKWKTQWKPGVSMEWSETHFPGRGEGVESDKVYEWEEEFNFRAGSYSWYGWWRAKLEEFKGEKAFQELIDFADNEGVIGYVVSKKLLNDFVTYDDEAKKFAKTLGMDGEYWIKSYENWKKAFEIASENGAVDFH